jgi:L-fuconolactonase
MSASGLKHSPVRDNWLATTVEDPIDPTQPIIDSHHHLFDRAGLRYMLEDLVSDIQGGHNVVATVIVQARSMLRAAGPEEFKPIGETEFANGVAAMSASGNYGPSKICNGIVGFADLRLGDRVQPVLEAHLAAAGGATSDTGRFCGIRQGAVWDADQGFLNPAYSVSKSMLDSSEFRRGFRHLEGLGLTFDAWVFFHQLPKLLELAKAFPTTSIVVDHCGGILGIERYAGQRSEVFQLWKQGITDLAKCPNVMMKLGGLGMKMAGFKFDALAKAPSSKQLASAWKPWIETCVEAFGASRCMVESNFPVDKGAFSYRVCFNAFQRLFAEFSQTEKDDIFYRCAARFYSLSAFTKSVAAEQSRLGRSSTHAN